MESALVLSRNWPTIKTPKRVQVIKKYHFKTKKRYFKMLVFFAISYYFGATVVSHNGAEFN